MAPDQIEFLIRNSPRKKVGVVSEINVYPVKSSAQVRLTRCAVGFGGLEHDRSFMVADPDTREFVTQRQNPKMALLTTMVREDGKLVLAHSGDEHVVTPLRGDSTGIATVWGEECSVVDQGDDAAAFISSLLGQNVRLVAPASDFARPTSEAFARGWDAGLADGFPFLLTSEASTTALNSKLGKGQATSRNFRPNIVVKDSEAWSEDQWSIFRIGSVVFQAVKPCSRCRMTAVDPVAGVANALDTMGTLHKYRKGKSLGVGPWGQGEVFFGQNLVAHNEGEIATGDAVEVILFENWDKIVGARADLKKE
eukprot:TRINITY_DN25418_c0_g1_i1.p1 TRINITY_DN25418_c0_g1~~TRINITY_DN25418_c0_g1_i1.p1  ORF type:complete len:309 (-),score=44.79 TRINITY_DN25418_c0_g1_i1:69-995(-)